MKRPSSRGDWWMRAIDRARGYRPFPWPTLEESTQAMNQALARYECEKARALIRVKVILDSIPFGRGAE